VSSDEGPCNTVQNTKTQYTAMTRRWSSSIASVQKIG